MGYSAELELKHAAQGVFENVKKEFEKDNNARHSGEPSCRLRASTQRVMRE